MVGASPQEVRWVGEGLCRPECVLTTRTGDIFCSYAGKDDLGGVSQISASGSVRHIVAKGPPGFLPNGIALLPDRSFLLANLGPSGGVYHLSQDGHLSPFLLEIEGRQLPPTNFVGIDRVGRTWVTVSTWRVPREQAMIKGEADGFVILKDERGARIVAENIGFTNEGVVEPSGEWLYVNETIARRTSRFRIHSSGDLGPRETVAEYDPAIFPDGLTFDEVGGIWIVSVSSNRVVHTSSTGKSQIWVEDCDPDEMADVASRYEAGEPMRPLIDIGLRRPLRNLASIAFGGADLSTFYLGTLAGDQIGTLQAPVAGAEPVHWRF